MVTKVVFFYCDDQLVMGVLPGDRHLNIHRARHQTNAQTVRLATEREIAEHVGTIELGAVPPFGSLFGLPMIVDEALVGAEAVEVAGGMATKSLRLRLKDLLREEAPQILPLSRRPIRRHTPTDR